MKKNKVYRTSLKATIIYATLGILINSASTNADNSEITAIPDFKTKIENKGGVYEITPGIAKNNNAFNGFNKFQLGRGDIANLHFKDENGKKVDNLFNFVQGKIDIDGTVNAIRDNAIGGNLYFLSSDGMVIGKNGTINAGSFQAITPTTAEFKKALEAGIKSEVYTPLIAENGKIKIPVNANGSITVEGKINAIDDIALYSSSIKIGETGHLKTGITDFSNIVNIEEIAKDTKLKVTRDPNKGNIILSAHADTSKEEKSKNNFDGTFKAVEKFVKSDIVASIESSGNIEAAKDLTIEAIATNGEYNKTKKDKESYNSKYGFINVKSIIDLKAGKIKAENVYINSKAKNYYDTPALAKAGKFAFSLGTGGSSPININGTLGLSSSESKINIGNKVSITSNGKTEINSFSGIRNIMGASTSPLKIKNFYLDKGKEKLPSIAAAYIDAKSNSNITIEGTIEAKEVDIKSKSENTIDASVKSGTIKDDNKLGVGVLITNGENHSSINIKEAAKITSKDRDINIESKVINDIRATVLGNQNDKGVGAVAVNVSNYRSSSKINIDGKVKSSKKVNIDSRNITKNNIFNTKIAIGTSKIMNEVVMESKHTKALMEAIKQKFGGEDETKVKFTDLFSAGAATTVISHNNSSSIDIGKKAELSSGKDGLKINSVNEIENIHTHTSSVTRATRENETKKATVRAAVFYGNIKNNSSVKIADDAKLSSDGKIEIKSENKLEYRNPNKMAKELIEKLDLLKKAFSTQNGSSITENESSINNIENLEKLIDEFSKKIDGKPETLINGDKITIKLPNGEERTGTIQEIAQFVQEEAKKLESNLEKSSKFKNFSEGLTGILKEAIDFSNIGNYANFNTFNAGAVANDKSISTIGGAVSWTDLDNHSNVTIGRATKINAKENLDIESINKVETVSLVGKPKLVGSSQDSSAIGGSLNIQNVNNTSIVEIKERAELNGENINIGTKSNIFYVGAALNAGKGGNSINGMGSYNGGSSSNILSVDDEAILKADKKIKLEAKNDTSVTNVAGAIAKGEGNAAVGIAVAVNKHEIKNKSVIEDNDGNESLYEKNANEENIVGDSLELKTNTTGKINSISLAGGITKAGENSMEEKSEDGFFNKVGNKVNKTVDKVKTGTADAIGLVTDKITNYLNKGAGNTSFDKAVSHNKTKGPIFSIAGAGSVSLNDINSQTSSAIDGVRIKLRGTEKSINTISKDSAFIGAWSGAAAIQWHNTGENNKNIGVGVAGAVAVNTLKITNKALIKNSVIENAKEIKINALNGSTHLASGLGLGISKDSGNKQKKFMFGGAASVNLIEQDLSAEAENNTVIGENANVDVTAYKNDTQVTGGLNIQTGKASGAVGASIAIADIKNNVKAEIKEGNYKNINNVDVKSLFATTQVTTAVAAGGVSSNGKGIGTYQGAVTVNQIKNNISASIDGATIENAKEVNVIAKDTRANSNLVKEYQAELNGKDRNYIEKRGIDSTGRGYYSSEDTKKVDDKKGSIIVAAALSVAGSDKSALGSGVSINLVNNNFDSKIKGSDDYSKNSKISSEKINVDAKSEATIINSTAGLAASKDSFAGMGSVAWQELKNKTAAEIKFSEIKTNNLNINAKNNTLGVNIAGAVAGTKFASVGASVANSSIKNKATSSIYSTDVEKISKTGVNINVNSENKNHITNIAAGAAISSESAGIEGSVATGHISNETDVNIAESDLKDVASAEISAKNNDLINNISGSINGGKVAAIGGSVAYTDISAQNINVKLKNVSIKSIDDSSKVDVKIKAEDNSTLNTIAVGAGGSRGFSVQGAAATAIVKKEVSTSLEGTIIDRVNYKDKNEDFDKKDNGNTSEKSSVDLLVLAENNSNLTTNASVVSVASGVLGAGMGVSVNKIVQNTSAILKDGTQNVRNILVKAKSNSEIKNIGIGGSAGVGGTGVTGSIAINKIENNTIASAKEAKIKAKGNAGIISESDETISNYAGLLSGGASSAIGTSTSINEISGTTKTLVEESSISANEENNDNIYSNGKIDKINEKLFKNLDINSSLAKERKSSKKSGIILESSSTHTLKSLIANGGIAGKAAINGTVNVNKISGNTETVIKKSSLSAKNQLIHSGDYTNITGVVGALSVAEAAGIGAASDTNIIKRDVRTSIEDKTKIKGNNIEIIADSKQGISSFTVGVAGGVVGAGVAGNATVTQLEGKIKNNIEDSEIDAEKIKVKAEHYGVVSTGNAAAGIAIKGAGIGASVAVLKDKTETSTNIKNSKINSDKKLDLIAENTAKSNIGIGAGGIAGIGAGISGSVSVNNVSSKVKVDIDNSELISKNSDINIVAHNKINSMLKNIGVSGGAAAVTGVTSVNTINSNVFTRIHNNSKLKADMGNVNISSKEYRDIDQLAINAGIGGIAVGANVLINNFASIIEDKKDSNKNGTEVLKTLEEINKNQDKKIDENALKILKEIGVSDNEYTVKAEKGEESNAGIRTNISSSSIVGKNVSINAEQVDNIKSVGGGGTLGAIAASGTVAITNINRNLGVLIENSELKAKEKMNIESKVSGSSKLNAYQGSIGALGLGAAYAELNSKGKSSINIKNSKLSAINTEITVKDEAKLSAESHGLTAGVVAAGAIITKVNNDGSNELKIDGSIFNPDGSAKQLILKTEKSNKVNAKSVGGSYGVLSGVGVNANAKDTGRSIIDIKNKSKFNANEITVEAASKMEVAANADNAVGTLLGGIGVSQAVATTSSVNNVNIMAGNTWKAKYLTIGAYTKGLSEESATKATTTSVSGSGIGNGDMNIASASSSSEVNVNIGKQNYQGQKENTSLNKLYIYGNNNIENEIDIKSFSAAGIQSLGSNKGNFKTEDRVSVNVDGGKADKILIESETQSKNIGSIQGDGGALTGDGTAIVENINKSNTELNISGEWKFEKELITNAYNKSKIKIDANGVKGGGIGKNGITLKNDIQGKTSITFAKDSKILGNGNMFSNANNVLDINIVAQGAGYGGIGKSDTDLRSNIVKNAEILIDKNVKIETKGKQVYQSYTEGKVDIVSKVDAAGGTGISNSKIISDITTNNIVKTEDNATLKAKEIILATSNDLDIKVEGIADSRGAGSKATSTVESTFNRKNNIYLGGNLYGIIDIYAGLDHTGKESRLNYKAISHANSYAAAAFANTQLKSKLNLENKFIQGKNLNLQSLRNVIRSKGKNSVLESNKRYTWYSKSEEINEYKESSAFAYAMSAAYMNVSIPNSKEEIKMSTPSRNDYMSVFKDLKARDNTVNIIGKPVAVDMNMNNNSMKFTIIQENKKEKLK